MTVQYRQRYAFTYVCPQKKQKTTATSHPTHCWSHHTSWCVAAVFVSADASCRASAQLENGTGNHLHLAWHSCCSPMRCHFCPATWLPWAGGLSRLFMKLWRRRAASHRSSSNFLPLPAQKGQEEKICCTYARQKHMSFRRGSYQRKWCFINYH